VIAVLFRRMTFGWRAISVGFGSAVVGAGIATLALSIIHP